MLYGISLVFFVLICFCLIGIILLQASKTGGMGTAMGQQAMGAAFGGEGGDKLLVKITAFLASMYMISAIVINLLLSPTSNNPSNGIIESNINTSIDSIEPIELIQEPSVLDTTK